MHQSHGEALGDQSRSPGTHDKNPFFILMRAYEITDQRIDFHIVYFISYSLHVRSNSFHS
jgi:hypothetical protein